ncbi:MAG: hypothetical protein FJ255_05285 [Phycisphaerae bacterium]|nr:hypothetical protein [Phycisphaerae bacterium]
MSQPTYTPPGEEPAVTVTEAFSVGWWAFKSNYGMLLLAVVVIIAISFGLGVVQVVVENALSIEGLLTLPLMLLVSAQLQAGSAYIGVRAARGEKPDLVLLFRGFSTSRLYWSLAGAEGITILIAIACLVPALIVLLLVGVGGGVLGVGVVVIAMAVAMISWRESEVRGRSAPGATGHRALRPMTRAAVNARPDAGTGDPQGGSPVAPAAPAGALVHVLPTRATTSSSAWGSRAPSSRTSMAPGPSCPECGAPRHPEDPVE